MISSAAPPLPVVRLSPCRYLHITGQAYGRPIAGQKEVSAVAAKSQANLWRAMVCVCEREGYGVFVC